MDMENINSMWGIIGIIVCACGVYALYWFYKMKTTGDINATILLGKDFMYKKCKNKDEYIRKVFPGASRARGCSACLRRARRDPLLCISDAGRGYGRYGDLLHRARGICGIHNETETGIFLRMC